MEEINEWQQIEQSGWKSVIIDDNYLEVQGDQSSSIYDPLTPSTHHGGSQQMVPSPTTMDPEENGTSSSLTASSSVSDQACETPTQASAPLDWVNEGKKLLKLRFEAMRAEVVRVASKVRNCAICAGAFWSITYVAGAAAATAVLVSLVYVGIRRRRRKVDRLDYLLRQKDEKISQLLLQIANLNEALSSRHKVPVHRVDK